MTEKKGLCATIGMDYEFTFSYEHFGKEKESE